jgi:hypothetical protein
MRLLADITSMSVTTDSVSTVHSRFARLSTWQARGVLAALALLLGIGLWNAPTPPPLCDVRVEEADSNSDVYLYMSEVRRIHAGENYYQVAAELLPKLGYPTASVFNWRTPLPMWLIAKLPDPLAARLLLIAAGIAMLLMSFEAAAREQPNIYRLAMPLTILLCGPMLPCFQGNVFVLSEVWAGIFIAVSLAAYGVNLRFLGATMGLAALFFRELALPYCIIGLALAVWQRRPKESLVWIIGMAGWAVYYGLHCWKVTHLITAASEAHRQGWFRFGGLTFVVAVAQMNACLVLLPVRVTVVYFVLAIAGFAGWQSDWGRRITLAAACYIAAFSMVGQEFNRYWGLMITPLFCYGAVHAPRALADLWQAAKLPLPRLDRQARVAKSA